MVNIPEEPFKHGLASRNGRLKVYDNIYGDFCRQMRTPCVIFTGHPSLRIGNAVHFLEMWGNDSKNALIMTDPDYPIQNVYGPYEKLSIRAFFFPIETRLDFSQLNPSILPDLAPKLLVMPEVYTQPPPNSSQRTDFVVAYNARATFRYGDTFTIPSTTKTKRVRLHPDTAFMKAEYLEMNETRLLEKASSLLTLRSIELRGHYDHGDIGLSSLKGILSVYDNILELNPDMNSKIRNVCVGKLSAEAFAQTLGKMNLKYSRSEINGNDTLKASVCIKNGGFRTVISSSNRENRQLLSKAVAICLKNVARQKEHFVKKKKLVIE
uniref:Beta-Casp domain-containing protein n=1 Tax=Wuchereria bancrofti TaxID=6293 RepID=A0A1I8EW06_WUCBA